MNTCGALGGALVAGFLLLPALGSRGALLVVASALMISGLLLILDVRRRRGLSLALSATAVAAFVITALWTPDPFVVMLARVHPDQPLLWKMEGVQTTASVHLRDLGNAAPNRVLYLNGAHQANDHPQMALIHHRIGYLPMVLHPQPRQALVVGLGGGATAGSVSRFPGVELDVIELAESVVQASEWFRPINFDVLHRSNAHLRIEDGRNYLMMTRNKNDVITADLILPVHAGANHLYSLEYFELVKVLTQRRRDSAPVAVVRERLFRVLPARADVLAGVSRCDRLGRRHPVRRFAAAIHHFPPRLRAQASGSGDPSRDWSRWVWARSRR